MAEAIFWLSAGCVAYVYFGYTLLLTVWSRLAPRPVKKGPAMPFVSLVTTAFNEERVIEEKIRVSLALDYPEDRYEIVVVSDGSKDRTVEIARRFEDGKRVRVLAFEPNRGKLQCLNDAVPQLKGEIVAFSDASSMPAKNALRELMANFADPEVGACSGVYQVLKKDEAEHGGQEGFYWKYETYLKLREAEIDSILGCHGSLYAIRKALYPFPSPDTINDDYVIPLRILHGGHRVAYEPAAVAYEEAKEMGGFSRRIRIMAGNFEQLREMGGLLNPPRWKPLFFFVSHKLGRLVAPAAMAAALVANLFLLDRLLYQATLALQLAFYGLSAMGAVWPLRPKILRAPYYFTMINVATLWGLYYVIVGRGRLRWKKAA